MIAHLLAAALLGNLMAAPAQSQTQSSSRARSQSGSQSSSQGAQGPQASQSGSPAQDVQVRRGTRLEVSNFLGDVKITGWDRDTVHLDADSYREPIDIRIVGSAIIIRPPSRMVSRQRDVSLTIPSWMAINVTGVMSDVTIEGADSEISVETIRGDITLRGGSGFVSAKSFQGHVTIEKAKGRIEAEGVNQGVRLVDVSGDIAVGTVNGSVTLERVDTANLDVSSVNGSISYDGPIKDKGMYRLTTHNGTVGLAIPEKANATIRVRTYGGSFRSTFPVKIDEENRQNRFTLALGDGSARVELESFNGSIALVRPGEPMPANRGRVRVTPPPPAPPAPPAPAARPAPSARPAPAPRPPASPQ